MPKKILMVDDETDYTNITKIYMEDAGDYQVTIVNRGARGYDVAKQTSPDIILMDISMPDMSGYDVARQIVADEELKNVPIIFFTGVYLDPNDRLVEFKDFPYITKPTSGENLIQFIEKYLNSPN